ncbi:MAG: amino acid-binding protein [Planctomycetes bacterium]|nr:amino acid-binding protein [Planctomycetota bacterium]
MKSNSVKTETQFSVLLANKPGMLAGLCQRLADDKVNIMAMSMMDSTEHGVLRLVTIDPPSVRGSLSSLDLPTTETTVLTAELTNRPGALADVVQRLAAAHIDVSYAYCTSGAAGGKTLGVFKVSDVNKATKALSERKPRRKNSGAAVRPESAARRK